MIPYNAELAYSVNLAIQGKYLDVYIDYPFLVRRVPYWFHLLPAVKSTACRVFFVLLTFYVWYLYNETFVEIVVT